MKNIPCLMVLIASVFVALTGCESTSSSSKSNESMYDPIPEREPVLTGEYYKFKKGEVTPRPLTTVAPIFPLEFKRKGVMGEALVAFIANTEGKPEQVQIIKATHRGFGDAAVACVKKWRYKGFGQK